MNNNTNNQNGTVLGSVNNNPEVLDTSVSDSPSNVAPNIPNNSQVLIENGVNSKPVNSGTFFNTPINNPEVINPEVISKEVPPQPMPAYTNPDNLNPMPNNTYQPQNTIGITPPVSFEPEPEPKKKINKNLIFIIIGAIIVAIGFGVFYVLRYTDLFAKKEQITIETKSFEVYLGDVLPTDMSAYATITGTNVSNCNPVDVTEVNLNAAGTYQFTVTCGSVSRKGTITVIDNIEMIVETKTVYKAKGETLLPREFALNSDDGYTYHFANQTEVDKALASTGTFTINLKVSNGTKTADAVGKLVVLPYPVKGYITCTSPSTTVSTISASKEVSYRFAILNDGMNNTYGGIAYEITTFKFTDTTGYTNYKNEFDENKIVTIDGVSGSPIFNEIDHSIIFTKELDNNDVLTKYGVDNMKDYRTINKYFGKGEGGLGYACIYKKAE